MVSFLSLSVIDIFNVQIPRSGLCIQTVPWIHSPFIIIASLLSLSVIDIFNVQIPRSGLCV